MNEKNGYTFKVYPFFLFLSKGFSHKLTEKQSSHPPINPPMQTFQNFSRTLSKSDYKTGQSCPVKLFYKKNGYPSSNEGDAYLELLAEGGYAVGAMATLYYPTGVRIHNDRGVAHALEETAVALERDQVVLFEAAIAASGAVAVVDILVKEGQTITIIEVKSKAIDLTKPELGSEWNEHLDDIAFQSEVIQEAFPAAHVKSLLFVPDKSRCTDIEGLYSQFAIRENGSDGSFRFYDVEFLGDAEAVRREGLMVHVDVMSQVEGRRGEVRQLMDQLKAQLEGGVRPEPPLGIQCFSCEYNCEKENAPNGFRECWSEMPEPEFHIRDVYHLGTIKASGQKAADAMISAQLLDMRDLPPSAFTGKRGARRRIQVEHTLRGTEWKSPDLAEEISGWSYPLHFVDFETTTTALPLHRGLAPYETVAFQWSCHTIPTRGAEPIHTEWLSPNDSFPNFTFARRLMDHLGDSGTFLMWSSHEHTVLRHILDQIRRFSSQDPSLQRWLEFVVRQHPTDTTPWVDMNALALRAYFHPLMGGKTSIKRVLPAVLSAARSPRIPRWLDAFSPDLSLLRYDKSGQIANPYDHLPPVGVMEGAERVAEGTAAMRAYQDMWFGLGRGREEVRAGYREALLRYCRLDTLAMVVIWEHWRD